MKTISAVLLLVFALTEVAVPSPKPVGVGMVALVANPQKYEGKVIRTVGFLLVEFESDALFVHEEDCRHGLTQNSMALRLSQAQRKQFKNLSGHYVIIEATVHANGPEAGAMWAGALGEITRVDAWQTDRGTAPYPER